ncbi:LysM peptidoglycan-binding domain-containing protein [Parvibium lacunae]|uniref:LysM peptidoglycan-binding domain-containing protein n=2 Tax=Parvibium lacunae TaxID=1888893 RepID=A0A368L0A6_9BURK|nr:LysM peptidoglycan-binding domain-containing protein [Parvibium lacunae]
MKKFSTAIAFSLITGIGSAWAQPTPPLELADNVPDRHIVVKGDTLWDIAGKFLKSPWRWPEIWQLNKEQIRDPHWIYPGDIVYLDKTADGQPRLRLGRPIGGGANAGGSGSASTNPEVVGTTTKLQPQVRVAKPDREAIGSISPALIEPYLSKPLIVGQNELTRAARIVATQEGRVVLATSDVGYVRGLEDETTTEFQVFRPATPLKDPVSKKVIAYEAQYLGTAKLVRKGDPATVMITSFTQEIGIGDRLLPAESPKLINYVPRPAAKDLEARVVSIYGSVGQGAQTSIITLNAGSSQGLEVGQVVAVWQYGRAINDRTEPNKKKRTVVLPDERNGEAFVFRVFDNISYALVMKAAAPIDVNDRVTAP